MNGVSESTTTTGTGDLTTSQITGRPRFTDVFAYNASEASADLFPYAIVTRDSPPQILEWGRGWMSAVGTLVRQEILGTLVSGTLNVINPTAVNLPAGTKDVVFGALADFMPPALNNMDSTSANIVKGAWANNGAQDGGSSGTGVTYNRCYYQSIYIDTARVCNGVVIALTANAAGSGKSRVALYSVNRNGYPGRKLIETANIDLTAGAGSLKTAAWAASAKIRLLPGWYYLAHAHDWSSTNPQIAQIGGATGAQPTPFGLLGTATIQSGIVHRYEALSGWTDLPATPAPTNVATVYSSGFKVGVTFE